MDYNDVKRIVIQCREVSGLDEVSQAFLLRHGDEIVFDTGEIIYAEGAELDDSFCVLLSGSVAIERGGKVVAETSTSHIFGDMAYFFPPYNRTATVRATSPGTAVLKVELRRADLSSLRFTSLKTVLGRQRWNRPVA